MTEGTHGLKDLFGSPDETPRQAAGAPQGASAPAPQETLARAARPQTRPPGEGHGLSGLAVDGAPAGAETKEPPVITPPRRERPGPERTLLQPGAAAPAPQPAPMPTPSGSQPLSCVLLATDGWRRARRTAEALALQTAASRIELIIVSPEAVPESAELQGLGAVRHVAVPHGARDGVAVAEGVRAAGGPLVALIDDYAFPASRWAERIIARKDENFAALGSTLTNANPRSTYSWGNMLMESGAWRDGRQGGEVSALPPGNLVFHRRDLLALGDEFEGLIDQEGALSRRLAESGRPLEQDPEARIAILNPSTLRATVRTRFAAGRLAAAREAEGWSFFKRFFKALPAAFGGWRRYRKEGLRLFSSSDRAVHPKIQGRAVLIGMIAEGLGRSAGYLRGPGKAAETRRLLERRRLDMLSRVDRRQFEGRRQGGPRRKKR